MPTPEFGSTVHGFFKTSIMGVGAVVPSNGYVDVVLSVLFALDLPNAFVFVDCADVSERFPLVFISSVRVVSPHEVAVRWANPVGSGVTLPAAEYKVLVIG